MKTTCMSRDEVRAAIEEAEALEEVARLIEEACDAEAGDEMLPAWNPWAEFDMYAELCRALA